MKYQAVAILFCVAWAGLRPGSNLLDPASWVPSYSDGVRAERPTPSSVRVLSHRPAERWGGMMLNYHPYSIDMEAPIALEIEFGEGIPSTGWRLSLIDTRSEPAVKLSIALIPGTRRLLLRPGDFHIAENPPPPPMAQRPRVINQILVETPDVSSPCQLVITKAAWVSVDAAGKPVGKAGAGSFPWVLSSLVLAVLLGMGGVFGFKRWFSPGSSAKNRADEAVAAVSGSAASANAPVAPTVTPVAAPDETAAAGSTEAHQELGEEIPMIEPVGDAAPDDEFEGNENPTDADDALLGLEPAAPIEAVPANGENPLPAAPLVPSRPRPRFVDALKTSHQIQNPHFDCEPPATLKNALCWRIDEARLRPFGAAFGIHEFLQPENLSPDTIQILPCVKLQARPRMEACCVYNPNCRPGQRFWALAMPDQTPRRALWAPKLVYYAIACLMNWEGALRGSWLFGPGGRFRVEFLDGWIVPPALGTLCTQLRAIPAHFAALEGLQFGARLEGSEAVLSLANPGKVRVHVACYGNHPRRDPAAARPATTADSQTRSSSSLSVKTDSSSSPRRRAAFSRVVACGIRR